MSVVQVTGTCSDPLEILFYFGVYPCYMDGIFKAHIPLFNVYLCLPNEEYPNSGIINWTFTE